MSTVTGIDRVIVNGGRAVVTPPAELDIYTAPQFRMDLTTAAALSAEGDIVVALGDLRFCDSTGLGCLIAAWKRTREAGATLHLLRVPPRIVELLTRTGMIGQFHLIETLGELPPAEPAGAAHV